MSCNHPFVDMVNQFAHGPAHWACGDCGVDMVPSGELGDLRTQLQHSQEQVKALTSLAHAIIGGWLATQSGHGHLPLSAQEVLDTLYPPACAAIASTTKDSDE